MDSFTLITWHIQMGQRVIEWYVQNNRSILDVIHLIFQNSFYVLLFFTTLLSAFFLLIAVYSLFHKVKKNEAKFDPTQAPFVTIQLPTRNELAVLTCARRCLAFDYPKDRYEIIIGDDSNDASVSRKLDAFAKMHPTVRIMRRAENIGFKPGNLINMLKGTNGDIIVIFDSDFLPQNDFLKRIVNPFIVDSSVDAVQSRWIPNNGAANFTTVLGTGITEMFHQIFLPFMHRFSKSVCLCGSAEAVRKSTLLKLGGWKSGSLTEDIEYSFRLYKHGKKVEYLHHLTCEMEVPHQPMDLYKQQMRWAYGNITATKEHLWDIIRAKIPAMLKMNVFLIISGYLFTGLLIFLTAFGTISFFTHPPGPINLSTFTFELFRNIAFTIGLLFIYFAALYKSGRMHYGIAMIVSAFSIGLVVVYYVNKGIYRSITNQSMQWFLVKKNGNDI